MAMAAAPPLLHVYRAPAQPSPDPKTTRYSMVIVMVPWYCLHEHTYVCTFYLLLLLEMLILEVPNNFSD